MSKVYHVQKTEEQFVGLTSKQVQQRQLKYGRNLVEEEHTNRLFVFLKKFWAPVPWMLEITILLQVWLGKISESMIITVLLLFNAILSYLQEDRANKALALLKQRLDIQAPVLRDGQWQSISAQDLVPGDIVYLRMGDLSPADIKLLNGSLLIDQSSLTGEALPIDAGVGSTSYCGALIKRGEATGEVIATGKNTYFGKTAQLIQEEKDTSNINKVIFSIVKYLISIDIILAVIVLAYALSAKLPITDIVPYILVLLVASIPIALPTTFTLATAFGAMQMAKKGVLVTHLLAIEDAAMMDIVCCDKTGTITKNQLQLVQLKPYSTYSEYALLHYAALASDEKTQDPIDMAILREAKARKSINAEASLVKFTPFDPVYKHTEAIYKINNRNVRVLKGAPEVITKLLSKQADISKELSDMESQGFRVLAIAVSLENRRGSYDDLELIGLIALSDPPRDDSKTQIGRLKKLGLRVIMITGDSIRTAKNIASLVGIGDVFAGMFPEDKYRTVSKLQKAGHVVGMTGDGVNDAPALKQAEAGIAVSNASDIAKASASIVLTQPGLKGIVAAVEISRHAHQKMLTYILNKIVKFFEIAVFLSAGLIVSGNFVITPFLIVLLLFTNDFASMSIATDNASFPHKPEQWKFSNLMASAGIMAILILLLSFFVYYCGQHLFHLTLPQLQTLIFVMLVFTGQGIMYLVRERSHFWHSMPGKWLILASVLDIIVVSLLASSGTFMAAINGSLIAGLLITVLCYLFIIDFLKIRIFTYFNVR